jgi:hypothetical protein
MERYSKNQSKVQKRYSRGKDDDRKVQQNQSKLQKRYLSSEEIRRGKDDDGKVQQKAVQSPEEIQQRRNCPRRDTVERVWNEIQESFYCSQRCGKRIAERSLLQEMQQRLL